MIEEKVKKEIPADKMQLQIEGGEILARNGASLDDYNVSKDCSMNLEILEKATPLVSRERKPKEVPKQILKFKVRDSETAAEVEI